MFYNTGSGSNNRSLASRFHHWMQAVMLIAIFTTLQNAVFAKSKPWGKDYFPNHELTAHSGEKLRFFDDVIADKVVALSFIFTSCEDVCPLETARLADVYRLLGDRVGQDIHFYSITIDPEVDTAEVLAAYAKRFGIDGDHWKFLTGNKKQIDEIRARFGVFERAAEAKDLSNHNINLVLGNQATGQWLRRSPFENPHILAHQLSSALHAGKTTSGRIAGDYAKAPAIRQLSTGEMMFRNRCSSCHVINGGFAPARNARALGPDLFAVNERRDPLWLRRWLSEPDVMLKEQDPIALAMDAQYEVTMPNFSLDHHEIESLIDYMVQETNRLRHRKTPATDHAVQNHAAHHEHHKHHIH